MVEANKRTLDVVVHECMFLLSTHPSMNCTSSLSSPNRAKHPYKLWILIEKEITKQVKLYLPLLVGV